MPYKSATVFKLETDVDPHEVASLHVWEAPKGIGIEIGLVPIIESEHTLALRNSSVAVRFRISQKKVPPSAVNLDIRRMPHVTSEQRKAKRDLKRELTEKLIEQVPHTHTEIEFIFTQGWLIAMSTSNTAIEQVLSSIRQQWGWFEVKPVSASYPLINALRAFLEADSFLQVDNIKLGDSIKVDCDGMAMTIRGAEYNENLLVLLKKSTDCHQVELHWSDITALISDKWQLRGIDCDFDHCGDVGDDPVEQERARLLYLSEQLPRFVKDIAAHAGGLVE